MASLLIILLLRMLRNDICLDFFPQWRKMLGALCGELYKDTIPRWMIQSY